VDPDPEHWLVFSFHGLGFSSRSEVLCAKAFFSWDFFSQCFLVIKTLDSEPAPGLALQCSVSDPYSFFTDPDPDPVDPDGGQYGSGYASGSGSNPDPGL
jgi:hypothetical protein